MTKIKRTEYINNMVVVIIIVVLASFISCQTETTINNNYRIGMVNIDSLKLSSDRILFKGQFVQIVQEKSSEEGTFIKTKNDSDKVYHEYISTICWLKKGRSLNFIGDTLKDTDMLIFKRIQSGKTNVITMSGKELWVKEDDIVFHNETMYKDIMR